MIRHIEGYLRLVKQAHDARFKDLPCFISANKIAEITGYELQPIIDYLEKTNSVSFSSLQKTIRLYKIL